MLCANWGFRYTYKWKDDQGKNYTGYETATFDFLGGTISHFS